MLTFEIAEDTRTHDAEGRGLEMGKMWVRCYRHGRYSGSLRCNPDPAYALAKRLLAAGWRMGDAATAEFVVGMANVENAFAKDAERAHLYDERGRLKG
jgi:hypothetical protein